MIAVMADPALFEEDFICLRSELAAVNFSSHFTVSAQTADLAAIEAELKRRDLTHMRLPVSFAFHSRWVDQAEASFAAFARTIALRPGRLPMACCERAATLSELPDMFFWNVARRPIRFRETVAALELQAPRRYIDIGPAGTLATFLKYLLPTTSASSMHAVLTPYGHDQRNLTALLAAVGR
jgi:bacillaene synthase trans-acting acyltransferase